MTAPCDLPSFDRTVSDNILLHLVAVLDLEKLEHLPSGPAVKGIRAASNRPRQLVRDHRG